MDVLRNIGFYTLEDERARTASHETALWRCELLLTSRCNFSCPYCRGVQEGDQGDLSWEDAERIVDLWSKEGLRNIRFSGGEPTLWQGLIDLVCTSRLNGINRVAVSTNGSAPLSLYKELVDVGVNDFSISLDSCCASGGAMMAGGAMAWARVVSNIKVLSALTYVTVGVVLTDQNIHELQDIVVFAHDLGVSDIRLITAAQGAKHLPSFDYHRLDHPILNYRLNSLKRGRPIRGIGPKDNHKCPLALDDMAVLNNKHYPCIIYLREQGGPIGVVDESIRQDRLDWYQHHDCYEDDICRNNCLDVCVDYNNRVIELGNRGK